MEIHSFTQNGSIDATFDGTRWTVPDDMTNGHRQQIAEWEANGNTIPAYVPPPTNPFPNLEPDQFWFVVRASGYEADLMAWVESMRDTNPVNWAAASAKLEFAKYFERDHPFIEEARVAIGMTTQELDALWSYA